MEIERKFLIPVLPGDISKYPVYLLEQAYLCRQPVIRVRKEEKGSEKSFVLTYKSKGLMMREEYNLPLDRESYAHLKAKADGRAITKKRYRIPESGGLTIELDVFEGELAGLVMAEVEFPDKETAEKYRPPEWFGKEVTYDQAYHNSNLSLVESCAGCRQGGNYDN